VVCFENVKMQKIETKLVLSREIH